MTTVNQVNKALAAAGYDGKIVKGKGYFYFIGDLMDVVLSIYAIDLRAYTTEEILAKVIDDTQNDVKWLQRRIVKLEGALRGIISSWDENMRGDVEEFHPAKMQDNFEMPAYWSPSQSLVKSEVIANARKVLAK